MCKCQSALYVCKLVIDQPLSSTVTFVCRNETEFDGHSA